MAVRRRDLGFGINSKRKTKRVINPDGSFNVIKEGNKFSYRDTYQALILMPWFRFMNLVLLSLVLINLIFTAIYMLIGLEYIQGITPDGPYNGFFQALYFSFQTFTTVGYGHLSPTGHLVSLIAALESMTGLVCFAVVTGLIYGRFSRPSTRLMYSENIIISPYKGGGKALMFRIANRRMSMLLELEAKVNLQITELKDGNYVRSYYRLKLELDKIMFFPLNWTLVHVIDEESPFYNMTEQEFLSKDAEVLILIKGFDDTFGQEVHSRYSYTEEDFVWDVKFKLPYETIESGDVVFHMDRLNEYEKVN